MSNLRFTDGVEIDTSGEYRTLRLRDGWYVVGHGTLVPCADQEAASTLKDELAAASGAVRMSVAETSGRAPQSKFQPRFPDVHVPLTGQDGNVFSIVARVRRALRRASATPEDLQAFTDEVMAAGSYDNALQTARCWVDVS